MSLTGNLEDLPLLDIIQIVSFSKKTGFLTIRTGSGGGAIVFRDGFVVSSFSPEDTPLGSDVPEEKRAGIVRRRIEMALQQLVRLREGQFGFSLAAAVPTSIDGRDIELETLEDGINPQELLLDLARGMDEDRRDSSAALEASFAEAEDDVSPAPEPEPAPAASPEPIPTPEPPPPAAAAPEPEPAATEPEPIDHVLLVEDEDDVRELLAARFEAGGYAVHAAGNPNAALKHAKRLGDARTRFILVTDLGMPTSGGSSFQGGFEVIKRLGKMHLSPPMLIMADSISPSLKSRARQLGVTGFVFKPGLSRLEPEQFSADMDAFAGKLVSDVLPKLARPRPTAAQPRDLAPGPRPAADALADGGRDLRILQARLEELRVAQDPSHISQLVMKTAREFLERTVLFLVKDEQLRGLGGFGAAPKDEPLNLIVRDIAIPLSDKSAFLDVVASRRAFSGPLPDDRWTQHLMGKIGRFRSSSVVLLPLLTHREAMAVLFGDNPETGRPPDRIDALEVFMTQAGVALENAFLQRKLQNLEAQPVSG